ncbi:MAG: imidazole glycerol phosphate synthase subunit HisH [Candidatus Pseudobacter hemicellulosilyticus]|uniref:Imidazole glycerol phosphate synthase subunit HisH n=1 Tax=Candidatus Pseudobacter hemicellulosilyticus TaxID=3121375 RepID=A0AAJ5WR19_9BACT|nr:MAG: imidazole glycerol phosphate synthase subunit HisH [Pseudobacter sp.]
MSLTIVKYNAGNIQSVLYALERIGVEAVVTDDHEAIRTASKVIFPGVGEASSAMRYLRERGLDQVLKSLEQPVLGICLGMQLMCAYSEENDTDCLGIFDEQVRLFRPGQPSGAALAAEAAASREGLLPAGDGGSFGVAPVLKVPQIGWNSAYNLQTPLFKDIPEDSYFYFVHGYYAAIGEHTIATTDYVQPYSAALHKGNFYGAQFHPEKSARWGEQLIRNFLAI